MSATAKSVSQNKKKNKNCSIAANTIATASTTATATATTAAIIGNPPDKELDRLLDLGRAYRDGTGVTQNFTKAFEYFKSAYAKKSFTAAFNLGHFYHFGLGCNMDLDKSLEIYKFLESYLPNASTFCGLARNYYARIQQGNSKEIKSYKMLFIHYATKAANLNDIESMTLLFQYYIGDEPSTTTHAIAFQYGQRLIKDPLVNQSPSFRHYYGLCFLRGYGVAINIKEALKHFNWVIAQKNCPTGTLMASKAARAHALIDDRYLSLAERQKHYDEAIKTFEELANSGLKEVRIHLILNYFHPNNKINNSALFIQPNIPRAKYWAKIAAAEKDAEALRFLADIYLVEKDQKEEKEAYENYKRSLALNDLETYSRLGLCHQHGLGVEKDLIKAESLYLQYKKHNEAGANYMLADLYFYQKNPDFVKYLELAAQKKYKPAMFILGIICAYGVYTVQDQKRGIDCLYALFEMDKDPFMLRYIIMIALGLKYKDSVNEFESPLQPQKIFKMIEDLNDPHVNADFPKIKKIFNNEPINDLEDIFEGYKAMLKDIDERPSLTASTNILTQYDTIRAECIKSVTSLLLATFSCRIAKCHLLGIGVETNTALAKEYLKKAADMGSAEGQYLYGRICESGDINEKALAAKYFDLAVAQNHKLAKIHLTWKKQLQKNNDVYFVEIMSFPTRFDQLTSNQNFLSLSFELAFESKQILSYTAEYSTKITVERDKIENLKKRFESLQQKANQLCSSFEENYKRIYKDSLQICRENRETAEPLLQEVKLYEYQYLVDFKEAKACIEELRQYRIQIEKAIETNTNKENSAKTATKASEESADDIKAKNEANESLQKESERLRLEQCKQKRNAWVEKQRIFFEKQLKKQALMKEQKKVANDFLEEISLRPVEARACSNHNFSFVKKPSQRILSEWQTHELLRIRDERIALEKAYDYINSGSLPKEKETLEDIWIVRQALIAILGRFMEVLQFITLRNNTSQDLSLNAAASQIRNLLLKRDYLDDIVLLNDLGSIIVETHKQKNLELLSIVKTLINLPYLKDSKLGNLPSTWQQFKTDLKSPLLDYMVEQLSPLPPVLTLTACIDKVEAAKKGLILLSQYKGFYSEKTFLAIVDHFLKSKWGAISAYVKRNKRELIKNPYDKYLCGQTGLICEEYIELGNRFRHAKEPLRFSTSKTTASAANVVSTIASTFSTTATTATSAMTSPTTDASMPSNIIRLSYKGRSLVEPID